MKLLKNSWFQNGVLLAAALTLYMTGYHTEVLGYLQRGVLMTGFFSPDVEAEPAGEQESFLAAADYGLQLRDRDGNPARLSDFRGQVILVNLWATWCPPCLAEMPGIEKLHEKVGDQVAFVLISRDREFDTAREFVARKGYRAPVYYADGPLPAAFRSDGIPATFVIAPDGRIAYAHTGMADYSHPDIEAFLRELARARKPLTENLPTP